MAFTISFYKISDPPNKLDKTVGTATASKSCTPFEPVSDLTGSVLIDYVAGIESCNYAQITQGENQTEGRPRYCFITDIQKDIGGRMRIFLREDPLMTFNQGIKESPILATRSSVCGKDDGNVGYNAYLDDGLWKCDSTTLYWLSPDLLNGSFDYDENDKYIILTAG